MSPRLMRLARPMAARPGLFALVAILICALSGLGYLRFAVDAGSGLLVGRNSDAATTYQSFSNDFGADPIVVVITARNPGALYLESNITRLATLERDLGQDPRVASVLGPGTVAGDSLRAINDQEAIIGTEYGRFVGDQAVGATVADKKIDVNKLTTDQQSQLAQVLTAGSQLAERALAGKVVEGTAAAEKARADFQARKDANARVIDGAERAAEDAVTKVELPPYFVQFVNTLSGKPASTDPALARQFFDRFTAGYGICDQKVAQLLSTSSQCQVFILRLLLDLPGCPAASTKTFCQPKQQWAAILPRVASGDRSLAILTVRLRADAVGSADAVHEVQDRIRTDLVQGVPAHGTAKATGPLSPTECGGAFDRTTCPNLDLVIGGAPLLSAGVTRAVGNLLIALFPVALLVMLILLAALFRVRGRVWPLLAAGVAALATLGLTLAAGVAITPAVLAGVPVLVGLGVDYAVQLVARFAEERDRGLGVEAALREVLGSAGPTTLVAALATAAGLLSLGVIAGIDLGSVLVAVPLVAEFALVLVGGIVLAWVTAVTIALPAAAWQEVRHEGALIPRRRRRAAPLSADAPGPAASAPRTAALARRWRVVLVPAAAVALAGWIALPRVPVQTDVEKLLAPSLQELKDINQVRALTGYSNEIDVYLQGLVAGPYDTNPPSNVVYLGELARTIRCTRADDVAQATSIADILLAGSATASSGSPDRCTVVQPATPLAPAPSSSPGLGPAPGSSSSPAAPSTPTSSGTPASEPTPGPSTSPSPAARYDGVVQAGRQVLVQTADTPAASAPAPTGGPPGPADVSPGAAPASPTAAPASPTAAPVPVGQQPLQGVTPAPSETAFVCSLRTFPALSRILVSGIDATTAPCPAFDILSNQALNNDSSPVNPQSARIALGVRDTSVAAEASLVDAIRKAAADHPGGLTSVQPTGLAVLAVQAYQTLTGRALFLNLLPLLVVTLVLLLIHREPRRALLPVLPTALAAGWSPLVVLLLGRLPRVGDTLGSLNPLTVVLGALVVALATEFGVVLLGRFYEERARGLDPDQAAAAAIARTGRAIGVSAATLGAGFLVLAISGLFPAGLPLIADFGLEVVIDLGLAVTAVFVVMLPVAVAIERVSPAPQPVAESILGLVPTRVPEPSTSRRAPTAPTSRRPRPAVAAVVVEDEPELWIAPEGGRDDGEPELWGPEAEDPVVEPERRPVRSKAPGRPGGATVGQEAAATSSEAASGPRRVPGMSARRRTSPPPIPAEQPAEAPAPAPGAGRSRLPGISGRRRAPVPPPVPAAPAPTARRRPGSVVPRRRVETDSQTKAPPEGVDMSAASPAVAMPDVPPPTTPTPRVSNPPLPPSPPAGQPDHGEMAPPEAARSRPRRRRPPPHVRRRGDGNE